MCNREFLRSYGATDIATDFIAPADDHSSNVIGRSIDGVDCFISDEEFAEARLESGGELCIGGVGVTLGYFADPRSTASKFTPHPLSNGRIYRTGDLVRLRDDSNIVFVGRADHQVKVRGHRLEPGEIEALIKSHGDAILEAVCLVEDTAIGNSLVAFVRSASESTESILRATLLEHLTEVMVPSRIFFVSSFPMTQNGKIDRIQLQRRLAESSASQNDLNDGSSRTWLLNLWRELLGVSSAGTDDDFFELGGHSLLAMRLVSRIKKSCSVSVPLRFVFENPTVRQIDEFITKAATA